MRSFAQVELGSQANNAFGSINQSVGDEIAIARFHEGAPKIIFASVGLRILDRALPDIDRLGHVNFVQWVQSRFKARQTDDDLENRSRWVAALRGSIDL